MYHTGPARAVKKSSSVYPGLFTVMNTGAFPASVYLEANEIIERLVAHDRPTLSSEDPTCLIDPAPVFRKPLLSLTSRFMGAEASFEGCSPGVGRAVLNVDGVERQVSINEAAEPPH